LQLSQPYHSSAGTREPLKNHNGQLQKVNPISCNRLAGSSPARSTKGNSYCFFFPSLARSHEHAANVMNTDARRSTLHVRSGSSGVTRITTAPRRSNSPSQFPRVYPGNQMKRQEAKNPQIQCLDYCPDAISLSLASALYSSGGK
jgi:hypothetical protein